jgi:hypothetical protein
LISTGNSSPDFCQLLGRIQKRLISFQPFFYPFTISDIGYDRTALENAPSASGMESTATSNHLLARKIDGEAPTTAMDWVMADQYGQTVNG